MTLIKPAAINDEVTYKATATATATAATTTTSNTATMEYRCHKCKIVCKRGDPNVIRAVGNIYHRHCFRCDFCNVSVLDKFYIFHHHSQHTMSSTTTASSIATEPNMLDDTNNRHSNHSSSSDSSSSSSNTFHDAVSGDEVEVESTSILCEKDYYQHSQMKCHQCNELITNDDYVVLSAYKYHKHCLQCPGCTIVKNNSYSNMASTTSLTSTGNSTILHDGGVSHPPVVTAQEIYDYDGRPYCRYHFSLIKGTECGGCGQAILHHYKGKEGGPKWHSECYMIQKYWHVKLIELEDRSRQACCSSKEELILKQNEMELLRKNIWKELSHFEDTTSKLISNIIIMNQSREFEEEYATCRTLYKQLSILFTVLDSLFAYQQVTNLRCDVPVQILSDYLAYFFDILFQSSPSNTSSPNDHTPKLAASANTLIKMASTLSQCIRDLIKLCLQQSISLERKFGSENAVIQQMLSIFTSQQYKNILEISCLDHNLQLIDMAITRLGLVLNIEISTTSHKAKNNQPTFNTRSSSKRPDEAFSSKAPTIKVKNNNITNSSNRTATFSPTPQAPLPKAIGISSSSAMNLHYLSRNLSQDTTFSTASSPTSISTGFSNSLRRNRSNRTPAAKSNESQKKNSSRMETIRRAFTTSRSKGLKLTNASSAASISAAPTAPTFSLLQNHRRDQKRSVSVYGQAAPLYISLSDIEQLDKYQTTLPLSPPPTSTASLRERRAAELGFSNNSADTSVVSTYLPELTPQQDAIIRHTALLFIETHIENGGLELDDLLSLVDIANSNASATSPTFTSASNTSSRKPFSSSATALWERLKSHIMIPSNGNDYDQHSVSSPTPTTTNNGEHRKMGVSLSNLSSTSLVSLLPHQPQHCANNHSISFEHWKTNCPSVAACFSSKSQIPNFLKDCILAMINQDITAEGIFRKNGNIRGLKDMCEQLDSEPFREDWSHFFMNQSTIQSAAFIKRFLRELPEPLLTFRLHTLFLLAYKVAGATDTEEDGAAALLLIHYAICLLPKTNRDILLGTLALLNWVARHSEKNKMTVQNLARVMAPNILYGSDQSHNSSSSGLTTISSTYSTSSSSHRKQPQQSPTDLKDVSLCNGEIWVISAMIEHFEELVKVPADIKLLLKHPKMSETLFAHSIDLTCSKHFIRAFGQLLKVKKEIAQQEQQQSSPPVSSKTMPTSTYLPPSPSVSASYR